MAISTKDWLAVKRFSYKFSILYFSDTSLRDHQCHVIVVKRRTRWYQRNKRVVDLLTSLEHSFLMAVTWYLWHHHSHIQVRLVAGDGLSHICNNLTDVARYIRNVQCNDNSVNDVLGCSVLLPAWHLAESCTCAKVFGLWNGQLCASFWWPSYYASTETCGTIMWSLRLRNTYIGSFH